MMYEENFSRDQYGNVLFGLSKQEEGIIQNLRNKEMLRSRLFSRLDILKMSPKALKLLVRDGVPSDHRTDVWMKLSGATACRMRHTPDYYHQLADRIPSPGSIHTVETVIAKWMPGHQMLSSGLSLVAVSNVAQAYCEHTQRMPEEQIYLIAAFQIAVHGVSHAEESFWIMTALLEQILPSSALSEGQCARGSLEGRVLEALINQRFPKLASSFRALSYSLAAESTAWFANLFIGFLPAMTVARVWDTLFCEGPKILYRVALALLKAQQKDFEKNLQVVFKMSWRIRRAFDADNLLKVAFKGIGPFPMADLKRLQAICEAKEAVAQEHHAKRLQALLSPKYYERSSANSMQNSSTSATSVINT